MIREITWEVFGVSSGRRADDKETWLWNEEVQESICRKRLMRKKWILREQKRVDGTEEAAT